MAVKKKKQEELPEYELLDEWWGVGADLGNCRFLLLRCPRERCRKPFAVEAAPWLAPKPSLFKPDLIIKGRSCPYCSTTAIPPKGL